MTNAIYPAISAIIREMAEIGISKDSENTNQGWRFRGIDAVYNALAPLLAKHKVIIFPRCLSREVTERATKSGSALFYVVVDCEFDFVSGEDGSKHTVKIFGEAMDSGDKATNKAMSIALKYAAFQTFFIPTDVNTNDPDQHSHQVQNSAPAHQQNEKPWYNSFEQDQQAMIYSIRAGTDTPESIIKQLSQSFKINKEIRAKIKGLA